MAKRPHVRGKSFPPSEGAGRWWAQRWWSVMEAIGVANRLERGKRYARAERVLDVVIEPTLIRAEVQGSRYEPYQVEIGLRPFSEAEWLEAMRTLASQALFSAKLLAGEMPRNIEDAFAQAGLSLFPATSSELTMKCSCPDAVVPCKHAVAVHLMIAERFDEDPFLLFRWRGRSREQILRDLRRTRAAEAAGRPVSRVSSSSDELSADDFWTLGEGFDSLSVSIGPPKVSAALLKRLGLPPFWQSHPEIRGSLERLYEKVTERAMALAYSGRGIGAAEEEE